MSNYIIIHGSFGSKDGNWFPWLKKELEKENNRVDVPQMPIGVGIQNYKNWKKELDKYPINENTVIIAHSIAPSFVCKYLIKNKIKVKECIFVCGFNNYLGIDKDYDAVNKPMYYSKIEEVKKYCSDIICFYSDNDPYVKFEVEKDFADKVSCEQYMIKNGGHLNEESGYTKFPELLDIVTENKKGPKRFMLRCAVHLLLIKDGKILVEKESKKKYGRNDYDLIAAHILGNENVVDAMVRTAKTEVNITVKKEDLKIVQVMHMKGEEYEYINYFFVADTYTGKIKNNDPEYCEGLEWVELKYPINHMKPYINQAIKIYLENPENHFTFYGWE